LNVSKRLLYEFTQPIQLGLELLRSLRTLHYEKIKNNMLFILKSVYTLVIYRPVIKSERNFVLMDER
jgi:hypothetical protein